MNEPTIDARLIDDKLFVDMDALNAFLRSEPGPYYWVRKAASAMQVPEDISLANGMEKIIEHLEFTAMQLREDLS